MAATGQSLTRPLILRNDPNSLDDEWIIGTVRFFPLKIMWKTSASAHSQKLPRSPTATYPALWNLSIAQIGNPADLQNRIRQLQP